MKVGEIRTLAGPNVYSYRPVLVMQLDLEDLTEKESREIDGFNDRLLSLLPGLAEHYCSRGKPGGFVERLSEGTYFGHIVEHAAIEMTKLVGAPVNHGKTRYAGKRGWYHVAVEYRAEKGTKRLLELAVDIVNALVEGRTFPLSEELDAVEKLIARTELGPSTQAIVDAATRRGVPFRRIGEESLVQLGYGIHRRLIQAAMSDQTSAVALEISSDKELTKHMLRESGIAVPVGILVDSESNAVAGLTEIGAPVVVKPYNSCQGKGVSLNLNSPEEIRDAFHKASQYSSKVIVEEQFSGRDYRVLVINGKVTAASERMPAHLIGDGEHTLVELIEFLNRHPDRGLAHDKPLTRVEIDADVMGQLRKYGFSLDYVPQEGEIVYLRECANLSTGGTAKDVTKLVHPEIAGICERVARVIGLDICGIDLIADDIAEPLKEGNGIIEVNAAPGLRMHVSPTEGEKRDVGDSIIEMLYPNDSTGRIPVISITGTNGKTTITRMIGHIIAETGKVVGMTTTDGIYVGGQKIVDGDTTGPRSARAVLADPAVEVAVLETARGGIVRDGLGYDWSDVSIISNIRLDHLGQDGIESLNDLLFIKSLVAERVRENGKLVLNADDERLAQLMDNPRLNRIKKKVIYFSLHPRHMLIRRHLEIGGTAYFYRDGWVVEAEGSVERRLIYAAEIPATINGMADFQVANALAAAAACRAYGLSGESVARGLKSFCCSLHNAGRAGLYEVGEKYVLIDYGHNPDAFAAICRMAAKWRGRILTGVVGVPGDRNNEVIKQAGRAAAHGFHRIIVKEDQDKRGRCEGEVANLLHGAIMTEAPRRQCRVVLDEVEAMRIALDGASPGEVIIVFYEKLEPIRSLLSRYGAKPIESIPQLNQSRIVPNPPDLKQLKKDRRFAQA